MDRVTAVFAETVWVTVLEVCMDFEDFEDLRERCEEKNRVVTGSKTHTLVRRSKDASGLAPLVCDCRHVEAFIRVLAPAADRDQVLDVIANVQIVQGYAVVFSGHLNRKVGKGY